MQPDPKALSKDEWDQAHRVIAAWRNAADAGAACPRCGADGLEIVDQSARPHAEWYALSCQACGLDVTLNLPLAQPPGSAF